MSMVFDSGWAKLSNCDHEGSVLTFGFRFFVFRTKFPDFPGGPNEVDDQANLVRCVKCPRLPLTHSGHQKSNGIND
jgi:hypothetical protein